jgi:hypothetical protein
MGLEIRTTMALSTLIWSVRILLLCACTLLLACGGGGGGSSNIVPTSSKPASSAGSSLNLSSTSASLMSSSMAFATSSPMASSSIAGVISLSGKVTYDLVPHNDNQFGLNYSATTVSAGRGLVIELLDSNNLILATTNSDNFGNYHFSIERNKLVKVRVKAQLLSAQSPTWNFKVTDNTNGNSVYAMDGSLVAVSEATAMRNLHAPSGWTGTGYTQPRVAAPFAILDSVLLGVEKVMATGNNIDFPSLELRWSLNNKAADGDLVLGEIGTSFYSGSAIYILGDENNDTDEYDRHVILHEWGHYLESVFSRSDSIGGDHVYGDKLDMRVAMSEGFANAFSAMMLDDPNYHDASGMQQMDGFINNISRKNHTVRGWYSEASVQSVLYNFYTSNNGKMARDFTDIFKVLNSAGYVTNTAMISIYVFADALRNLTPAQVENFNALLLEQNIETTNAFGEDESNSGGYTGSLPIYKPLPLNNTPVNVCSTNRFGAYNKLAVAQFLVFGVASAGTYQLSVQETVDDSGDSDPDLYLYRHGSLLDYAEGTLVDQESLSRFLSEGIYVLELVDDRARDMSNTDEVTACFDVRAQRLN